MAKIRISEFIENWRGRGYEKGESQSFWLELLSKVLGVDDPFRIISFEGQVKELNKTSFMDAYIASTKVLIEQKSCNKELSKAIPQSDGQLLNPFQQAKKYVAEMPLSKHPRWVVTCNFKEFRVYDMEHPQAEPEIILLENLETEYYRLQFLIDTGNEHIKKEMEVSLKAGEIIGEIYDALLQEYHNPDAPDTLRSLNILCVRLVFCLYAEDSGLFGTSSHSAFHDYLVRYKPGTGDMRRALIDLFDILNTPIEQRDRYIPDDLKAFPYVNGGLFEQRNIEVPRFNDNIANLLLKHASDDFDWSQISPTIFGAVFESTLNPQTRRSGGMHYTSIENIHKVIDPLFLDDLKDELEHIKSLPVQKEKIRRARAFQEKLASLKFLDPACGSGNFLTETFLSLRRLENEAIRLITQYNMIIGFAEDDSWIKVGIHQFYGIEINDFAVSTATTALWIAEAQMMKETETIIRQEMDFLPLKSYTNIVEGNALRMDWNEVVPAQDLNYIMGNPPFVGKSYQTKDQKDDMAAIFLDVKNYGNLDYVTSWYKKSVDYASESDIEIAFVSTNSICQGIAVPPLWRYIFSRGFVINFAHQTFKWNSEANDKAAVHCVIVCISKKARAIKILYNNNEIVQTSNINAYLLPADSLIIGDIHEPICDVPKPAVGSFPTDGGNLVIQSDEIDNFLKTEPLAAEYVKPYIGPDEFINGKSRYCLWLKDCSPSQLRKMPNVLGRIEKVRSYRLASTKKQTQKRADTPHLFAEIRQPDSDYLLFPRTSSERRRYLPIGFMSKDIIAGDTIIVPDATIYHFGILESTVHMAWMKILCGRLKSDYRYSGTLIYNNFPWPTITDAQKEKIEKTAQAILDARNLYPDCSLADLYDEVTMPPELRKAHQENDKAVMEAYGFNWRTMTESECVAELFKMYQKLTHQ